MCVCVEFDAELCWVAKAFYIPAHNSLSLYCGADCMTWLKVNWGRTSVDSGQTEVVANKFSQQRAKEFNKAIYFCFLDIQQAYDTVNREALWEILSKTFNIPEKLIRIIKALYSDSTGLICSEGQMYQKFPISVGVKQGDVLAPMLFNL